jgi:hypothetical protein
MAVQMRRGRPIWSRGPQGGLGGERRWWPRKAFDASVSSIQPRSPDHADWPVSVGIPVTESAVSRTKRGTVEYQCSRCDGGASGAAGHETVVERIRLLAAVLAIIALLIFLYWML